MTNFLETCYVGRGRHRRYPWGVVTEFGYQIANLHICSDWLMITKANIQSSRWATVTKLDMWVVLGTSVTHVVCRHQMCILNSAFAYFVLIG